VFLGSPILAYRLEITAAEIRIRKLPFYEQTIPTHDVTGVAEERTLVLLVQSSRIPLWGFFTSRTEELIQLLPNVGAIEPELDLWSRMGLPWFACLGGAQCFYSLHLFSC
jgi:hypothetical protein